MVFSSGTTMSGIDEIYLSFKRVQTDRLRQVVARYSGPIGVVFVASAHERNKIVECIACEPGVDNIFRALHHKARFRLLVGHIYRFIREIRSWRKALQSV